MAQKALSENTEETNRQNSIFALINTEVDYG